MTNVNNEANLRVQNLRVKKIKGLQEGSPDFLIGVDADGLVTQIATGDIGGGGGGGISDGDKGDITVSGTGTVWTIDSQAVTSGKIASNAVTTGKLDTGAVTQAKLSATGAAAGRVLQTDGTNMSWVAPSGGSLIPLTTAIADCENTTSEIDIVTATIPANVVAVGDIIKVEVKYTNSQNGASNYDLTQKIKNGTLSMLTTTATAPIRANVRSALQSLVLIVTGISSNTVTLQYVFNNSTTVAISQTQNIALDASATSSGALNILPTYSNNTFDNTAGTTLRISAQWTGANANTWIRVQQAQAYIIKKAV